MVFIGFVQFTSITLTLCHIAICSDLPPLTNGVINYSPSTTPRLEGATATYSCASGYQLSSDTLVRTCEDSGTGGRWNGPGMEPTCLGMS